MDNNDDLVYTAVLLAIGDLPAYHNGYSDVVHDARDKWKADFQRITGRSFDDFEEFRKYIVWVGRKQHANDIT